MDSSSLHVSLFAPRLTTSANVVAPGFLVPKFPVEPNTCLPTPDCLPPPQYYNNNNHHNYTTQHNHAGSGGNKQKWR
ncbi:hypothetical protein L6452_33999 [Arctium lappa]|uniref:Uncharacterized protein n=1 Tax=Arctium lappa TaxID=4217 RepID=A0ACB8YHK3_ARCLA|nr:hypothetical protein L6452_33999 [Arctium lappa]